ncbi:uncharacterized protein [Diadema antillarum]|uniref:uncharacterized protein n=1 Tax=Diadema antillarum TaxID=105358 RepID=UPI003A8B4A58
MQAVHDQTIEMDRGDSDDGGGSRSDLEQQADWASPPDSEDSSFCLSPLSPLPYEDEHPNKYVPWELKAYPPEITEAWTKVYNAIALRNSIDLTSSLEKLSTEVLDQPNDDGETLLYMAASRGLPLVVEILLKAGANPSKRETYYTDRSPLMIAVEQCHVACVEKLLEVVDVNEKNGKGFTALFSAAQCGVGRQNMRQLDPLRWKEKWRIIQPRNKIILEMLLDKGADVNVRANYDHTPLNSAVCDDNDYAVRTLLEWGADPLAYPKSSATCIAPARVTLLDDAVFRECSASLRVLLEKCSSYKELMSNDNTMRLAVASGQMDMVKCLVESGFDADLGVKLPSDELEQYRLSDKAQPVLATWALDNEEMVTYLLEKGASPLCKGMPFCPPFDHCPLYVAFVNSSTCTILRLLLERCAELTHVNLSASNVQFPVEDICVWQQPSSNFTLVMNAGLQLEMESAPFNMLEENECEETFAEVLEAWWAYIDFVPRSPYLLKLLGSRAETPRSLSHLCRVAVRRCISFPRLAKKSRSAGQLPVPPPLQDYIMHG